MQNRRVVSDDVKAFLRATIKSIWALELLLFLRSHADRTWSVARLTRELRASEPVVRGSLGLFHAAGLVHEETDGSVRFAPASPEIDTLVRDMADAYATHPVTISDEIYSPDSKIRNFADAFRLKKE
jgi:hypothetical protein